LLFCLARAAGNYKIEVHAATFLSNHFLCGTPHKTWDGVLGARTKWSSFDFTQSLLPTCGGAGF
jgi:hypothetical protein